MFKRPLVLGLLVTVGLFFALRVASAEEKIKIGIFFSSDQAAYFSAQKGIIEELNKGGFGETRVIFDTCNAEGEKEKAIAIAKKFKAEGMNLIITLGTLASIEAGNNIKDIPIVFTSVFDPVGAGIAKGWESSGNNTTGSSTWVDVSSMISTIRKISPAKRIGIIYTQEERNTVLQVEEFKKVQTILGFSIVLANLDKIEDAVNVANSLVGKVDCIFISGGNLIERALPAIMEVVKKARIISVAHLAERPEKYGVLLSVSANAFQMGELAGKKAIQVLRGKAPAEISIESMRKYDITINEKTVEEMGLDIPESFLRTATRVIR